MPFSFGGMYIDFWINLHYIRFFRIIHQMPRYYADIIYHHLISIEVFLYHSTFYLHQQCLFFFCVWVIYDFFGIVLQCHDTAKFY